MEKILKHKKIILLVAVIILAAVLRLYRIWDFMVFLGDEGRDVLVAKHILSGDLTLLGPRSSAADFFYGPIYYYFITPFLLLFNFDPVGPAVFIALMGVATVYLLYRVGKDFFGYWVGLIIAGLYAISPLPIIYSRSSWNPNSLPFFSLLSVYLTYKALEKKSLKLFFVVGILLGIALQLHYLSLFLGAVVAVYTLVGSILADRGVKILGLIQKYAVLGAGVIVGISPFLLFELRHKFPNSITIYNFIFSSTLAQQESVHNKPFFDIVKVVFSELFLRLLTFFPNTTEPLSPQLIAWKSVTFLIVVLSILSVFFMKKKLQALLLGVWLCVGVVLFGFYQKEIYDYYFAFLFPLPFLFVGSLLSFLLEQKKQPIIAIAVVLCVVGTMIGFSVYNSPLKQEPNRQRAQTKEISEFVLSKTGGKPFNFALLTPGNSDHAYRYFFEVEGRVPVTIENEMVDPERKTVTDQLLVVCENPPCTPLGHPLWEIAGFGRAEIAGEWDVSVVRVYRLTPYNNEQ